MNCKTAQRLMSAHHDSELAGEAQPALTRHLNECPDCSRILYSFQQLSQLASRLPHPVPPAGLWGRIERELDRWLTGFPALRGRKLWPRFLTGWQSRPAMRVAIAAALVLVATIGILVVTQIAPHDVEHRHLAADFDRYLSQFQDDPAGAQLLLLDNYDGRSVDIREATTLVRYEPAAGKHLPSGYSLQSANVLNMPCCTCVQVIWKREAGGYVAVFEHDKEQAVWFGDRPTITARCSDKRVRIVQLDQMLAATWASGERQLTVVGPSDIRELLRLVSHFGDTS